MFKISRMKLFPTTQHPQGRGVLPWYELVDGKVFRSYGHPEGASSQAEFIVRQDKVLPLQQRDPERPGAPWYVVRDRQLYPGYGHPDGGSRIPWFEVRD